MSKVWAPWMKVRVGARPIPEVVRELNEKNLLTPWMGDFLGELVKTTSSEPRAMKIARVGLFEIDFSEREERATFGRIIARGGDYGLDTLPLEAALLVRLAYPTQPEGETLFAATPARYLVEQAPCGFSLTNEEHFGPRISPFYAMPERRFGPDAEMLFKIRETET